MRIWDVGVGVIILGQKLGPDGSLPHSLQNRVDVGVQIWQNINLELACNASTSNYLDFNCNLILSGSDVANIGCSEARAMRNYITEKYESLLSPRLREFDSQASDDENIIDEWDDYIFEEDCSKNTIENALFCKTIVQSLGCHEVHVITNDFHLNRVQCIFRHVFANSEPKLNNKNDISNVCLQFHPASSGLAKLPYRQLCDRPVDTSSWHLSEILDFECNSVRNINSYFSHYGIPPLPEFSIEETIRKLRDFNESCRTS